MAETRNLRMDNAKAILIILVVIGHFLLPIKGSTQVCTNLFYVIYTFHMVAFTFLSGLFAQGVYKYRGDKMFFNWRKWFKILWLYLIYEIITFFSEIPAYGRTTGIPDLLRENGAPWYLMALLLWFLFIPLFSRARDKYICINGDDGYSGLDDVDHIRIIGADEIADYKGINISLGFLSWIGILIFSLATGYIKGVGDFLSLDRVTAFAPCFFAGYFIGPKRMEQFLSGESRRRDHGRAGESRRRETFAQGRGLRLLKYIMLFIGVISVVLIARFTTKYFMPYNNIVYGLWYSRLGFEELFVMYPDTVYIAPWILRLIWYIVAGSMTVLLLQLMPCGEIPVLTNIGQRTLQIYVLHRPVRDLMLAADVITSVDPANMLQLTYLILLSVVLTVFLASDIFTVLFKVLLYPFRKK